MNHQIADLFDKHSQTVYRVCYAYLRNKGDAEECLQETFMLALRKPHTLLMHPAPEKWLCQTARRVSLAYGRKRHTRMRLELDLEDFNTVLLSESFEDWLIEQSTYIADQVILQLRDDILRSLSAKELTLYNMRYVERLPVADISKRLGVNYSAVTTRLGRIKEKITKRVYKSLCDMA